MSDYIVYKTTTGEILRTGTAPDEFIQSQALTGETAIVGTANDTIQYIVSGTVTNKPYQSTTLSKTTMTADGIDSANILNAPIGANVTITGPVNGSSTIDGTDSFLTTVAGSYNLKITLFPYLDWSSTVVAN